MKKYQEIDEKNERSPDKKGKFGEGKQDAFELYQQRKDKGFLDENDMEVQTQKLINKLLLMQPEENDENN